MGVRGQPEWEGKAPGPAGVGLVEPRHAWLLGGGGAGSEVFPGHQATRVSPGGCNSSSAPVPLSGPAPGACYCRCGAAPPIAGLSLSPPLHPLPSPPLQEQFGVPEQCPCHVLPVPISLCPASPLPTPDSSLSPSRACARHPESIIKSCQIVLHHTGPPAKARVALATKDHCQHPDVLPR